ncbi:BQ5605_C040g11893 [Microbotryum silenes-dioicae]|uniref:BQ5605_C040g11893 protein n=1 Tax=Microbotryum silenes-dioicae TaxID=796604 RepID=A0A2X0PPE3_9BASI|nr:BQ5605_C040g11893 [Microbotryum silenes-dioicae]
MAPPGFSGGAGVGGMLNRSTNRFSALQSLAAEQSYTRVECWWEERRAAPTRQRTKQACLLALVTSVWGWALGGVVGTVHARRDTEIEDELARAQKRLRDLKARISNQSKKNFVLERDVRYLDSRIALLIQNGFPDHKIDSWPSRCQKQRMALDEREEVREHLEDVDEGVDTQLGDRKTQVGPRSMMQTDHGCQTDAPPHPRCFHRQQYSNLFFLLQSEPRHIAALCRLVSLSEIDTLLQTVMFTLYGNQYESREEHLLLTMFQSVLSAQFETATEFGSLLRANTPVSRMMTTYTRRGPGQSYLKSVLAERINSLIEHKELNLEINPLKVYEQMVNSILDETGELPEDLPRSVAPEVAAANPDVQNIIAPRLTMLMEIANSFLLTIMDSINSVPYGIRWICKQIRSLTKRKYPEATDYAICSLIGGFFFLRFVNPAIVTPQAYMLIDSLPASAKHPRRTLTLIAKMLQNLANKPSYSKEAYMMSLNPFVDNNKTRMNQFLNALCDVGDFYDTLEMDQYMALSKKDLQISITLNELYNTQSLLVQHIDSLARNDKQHLRILLDELGPAPAQVPRKENRTLELPLYSRWEMPIQDITTALMAENNVTQNDILYMETKSIFVQLIRSIPRLAERKPILLPTVAETAATAKDATLVRKGIKVKEMLRELEELRLVDRKDGYKLLTDEVSNELIHLGNLREKVVLETRSLEAVYKTIGDHNAYLRSQLEQYKAYLQNVRQTSGGKGKSAGVGVISVAGKDQKATKSQALGPFKFTHAQFEKDGIIVETNVPEIRRASIFFLVSSPTPGAFLIALHYKGREKAILEMDLKIDDLLEKVSPVHEYRRTQRSSELKFALFLWALQQKDGVALLDLEYVSLNVPKVLALLNKSFVRKNAIFSSERSDRRPVFVDPAPRRVHDSGEADVTAGSEAQTVSGACHPRASRCRRPQPYTMSYAQVASHNTSGPQAVPDPNLLEGSISHAGAGAGQATVDEGDKVHVVDAEEARKMREAINHADERASHEFDDHLAQARHETERVTGQAPTAQVQAQAKDSAKTVERKSQETADKVERKASDVADKVEKKGKELYGTAEKKTKEVAAEAEQKGKEMKAKADKEAKELAKKAKKLDKEGRQLARKYPIATSGILGLGEFKGCGSRSSVQILTTLINLPVNLAAAGAAGFSIYNSWNTPAQARTLTTSLVSLFAFFGAEAALGYHEYEADQQEQFKKL